VISKQTISIGLLLAANALLVVLLIVFSNQWWWQRLAYLDNEIKQTTQLSEQSQTKLLELVYTQLPLNKLLLASSQGTHLFLNELELLVLDPSRDYKKIAKIQHNLNRLMFDVENVWPITMDIKLLKLYQENTKLVISIIDEILETSSPVQLQLLMGDSKYVLRNLTYVMDNIELQSNELITQESAKAVSTTIAAKAHITDLEQTSTHIINQSILFMILAGALVFILQWSLYYVLRYRLSALAKIMTEITQVGNLERRVASAEKSDLIGNIGKVFNLMLDKLQLSQQQLQQQIERAQLATQAKGDFLANMSHEIRTPVHAITGIIHLMKEQHLSAKLMDYTNKADAASQALVHVINDVLDFSKISAGKVELEHKPFEILPSIEKHIDLFSSQFKEKNLDFILAFENSVPRTVVGDDLRLNQILINLINNALKFTHSGSVQLKVSCREQTAEAAYLTFTVEDTGIGIDQERIPMLFDAFSQGDVTTTRKYGGTGLGLAISHQLSQLMDGGITVTSQLEYGSRFILNVKLGLVADDQQSIFPELPMKVDTKVDVLIVCECFAQGVMLKQTLHLMGINCMMVESLTLAEQQLQAHNRFGLVLIDVPLQHSSTIDAQVKSIAEHDQLLTMPTVFMCATKCTKEHMVTAIEVIERPVKPSVLYNTVIGALGFANDLQFEFYNNEVEHLQRRQLIQKKIGGAKILIAEDVPINQQIIREILNNGGLHVHVVDNGQQALDILASETFDLVLMDLQMPVMGGVEATTQIRQQKNLAKLPVIAITANVMKGVIEDCKKVGFSDYLSKPLEVNKLWEVLGQWIVPADRTPFIAPKHVITSQQDLIRLDEQVPGINLVFGLQCVADNRSLYSSLLNEFLDEYGNSSTNISTFYTDSDFAALEQLAHAIKGVAANLGISPLSRASYEIEKFAKKAAAKTIADNHRGANDFARLLQRFDTLLEQSQQSISHIVSCLSPKQQESQQDNNLVCAPVDLEAVLASLSELKILIKANDGIALDLLDEIKDKLQLSTDNQYVLLLEQYLNQFDFEQSLPALDNVIQQIKSQSCAQDLSKDRQG
jgi:signal transduction histidine kinase/CheY-like chemotaxis protein